MKDMSVTAKKSKDSEDYTYMHKPDKGVLFANDRKRNPTQPDFTGNYTTQDGKKRNIAAWLNTTKNREYLSLSFSDPYNADD